MSDSIIKVEGLGKKYVISHEGKESYTALRDVISRNAKKLLTKKGATQAKREEFWALRDVSFEIKKGEAIGVIGRNGAGKSTLLKILSRITEPTHGKIAINGRIASLLEVGTGFHPELTGRENIFLNGAILGMSRSEIRSKFDEIVDFSGVAKFLDTPVKRYSSGMYVRLAFAVAAHLEPEILVVDEVLAVGDAEFQKKCLGKMGEVSKNEGRTILFVSHDLAAVSTLTSKSVWLSNGQVKSIGITSDVIHQYYSSVVNNNEENKKEVRGKVIKMKSMTVKYLSKEREVELTLLVEKLSDENVSFEFILKSTNGQKIALASMIHFNNQLFSDAPGNYELKFAFEKMNLASGRYYLDIACSIPKMSWDIYIEEAVQFEVLYSNMNDNTWDFKSEFGYGNIAWPIKSLKTNKC